MTAGAGEANFDGLVGPSHNYAGLAHGNLAAASNAGLVSNPRAAALQGIVKMRRVAATGLRQAFLPPPLRPDFEFLHRLGFRGEPARVLAGAHREAPQMLHAAWSAASMWTANAATVCPSADSGDGKLHLSVANLAQQMHRALEARSTEHSLRGIFANSAHFVVHAALPAVPALGDEGAANHNRFCRSHGEAGVQMFVYGAHGRKFRARQSDEASRALARRHGLPQARAVFAEQAATAIDAGVFHNDVISVSHRHLMLAHAGAFSDGEATQRAVKTAALALDPALELRWEEATASDFPIEDAVGSYVFNSQLLDDPDGGIWLLAPKNVLDFPKVVAWLDRLQNSGALSRWEAIDVQQSMRNGGGPACLRLRVVTTAAQWAALRQTVIATPARLDALESWVQRHYRDRLHPEDLQDAGLAAEIQSAQEDLARLLQWPELNAWA